MKNDFINLLNTVESKEQDAFRHYLHCFYSNHKAVLTVFEQAASSKDFNAELDALRHVSPTLHKNTQNALSDLKKWLLEFFAIQEVKNNTTEAKLLTLDALRNRGLHEAFQQKSKQLTLELDEQTSPDLWHLFWKIRLSHLNYFNLPLDRLKDLQPNMNQLLHDLDSFYVSAKLKYSAELYSRATIRQEHYNILLLDDVLNLIEQEKDINPIVKKLYLPLFELTRHKSETAYASLKQFLIDNPHHDAYDRQAILLYLINFTTSQVGKGEISLVKEWFELYKLGIHQSLFTIAGYFSITTYINILNVACKLEEYDWLKRFIKTWSSYLPPPEKAEIMNFALARLAFDEKDFDRVVELTKSINFKNYNIALNVRLILIRTYYEQQMTYDTLLDYTNAFYLYVYRNQDIGKSLKERTINFIKLFRHLINGKSKKMLLKELHNPQKITICHDWLKIKIDDRPF